MVVFTLHEFTEIRHVMHKNDSFERLTKLASCDIPPTHTKQQETSSAGKDANKRESLDAHRGSRIFFQRCVSYFKLFGGLDLSNSFAGSGSRV
jgi:hypothetical protein